MDDRDGRGLPRVMLVGGTDSSGRAGLDADRAAARAFECEPVAIVSAETDQDLFQVNRVEERLLWHREAADALGPDVRALKVGLLPGVASIVEAARLVARLRHGRPERPAVVDPVIRSSGGYRFWGDREMVAARDSLLVAGPILTPNLDELAELAWEERRAVEDEGTRLAAAERLLEAGASAVVVKGGHSDPAGPLVDLVVAPGQEPVRIGRERVAGDGIRGSGCRFATALACALARGQDLVEGARAAGDLVAGAIREAAAVRP